MQAMCLVHHAACLMIEEERAAHGIGVLPGQGVPADPEQNQRQPHCSPLARECPTTNHPAAKPWHVFSEVCKDKAIQEDSSSPLHRSVRLLLFGGSDMEF